MSRFLHFDLGAVAAHARHAVLADRNLPTLQGASGHRSAEPALQLFRHGGFVWLGSNGVDRHQNPAPQLARAHHTLTFPAVRLPCLSDPQSLPLLDSEGPQLMDLITQGLLDGAHLVMVDPSTLTVGVGRLRQRRDCR
ncbi:hypothetical protein [Micromonospora sp. HUAS LYJ1]|uniref:hypothetical protein n=1 Tax=Micromonospora sp. HUAS LYJ1 TaxID=3061626 RepID=UPI0026722EBD|nr:hypothetical protein [Micromonospora sp. HUAS LYJ1]WKU03435.1 hypothetical protein Q2K16_21610 [Micromonospora sp. HUAS LYJ1]